MSFRRRMVLLAAGAVAAAIVIASVVVYFVTRNELVGQIDASLQRKPTSVGFTGITPKELAKLRREGKVPPNVRIVSSRTHLPGGKTEEHVSVQLGDGTVVERSGKVTAPAHGGTVRAFPSPSGTQVESAAPGPKGSEKPPQYFLKQQAFPGPPPSGGGTEPAQIAAKARLSIPIPTLGGATGYVQLSTTGGPTVHSGQLGPLLPITAHARAVAEGTRPSYFSDVTVHGTPVRVFTEQAGNNAVWQAALPLTDLNSTLSNLRLVLALVCLGGIAFAGALGFLVSRAALVPVRRLTGAAEEVARTQDLGHRIEGPGGDELGRLASSFNTMLAALQDARLAQRQLVSDASHELRTPLTSVRANLDALGDERLDPAERAQVVTAVQAQLAELTVLVGDLVDLSKGEVDEIEVEDVRLDLAASVAVERAGLHAPGCSFALDAEPCLVRTAPARLDRAIANLLDNACRWNPPGGPPIEVRVRDGELQVRDHGPGISAEDLPHVFDRFYRAADARALPGSGLGLAIVRQVADMHGGSVQAENDSGGGARLTLRLPPLAMSEAELEGSGPPVGAGAFHDPPRSLSADSQVSDS
jgi:two-component system sensor histidine kinase MprB